MAVEFPEGLTTMGISGYFTLTLGNNIGDDRGV